MAPNTTLERKNHKRQVAEPERQASTRNNESVMKNSPNFFLIGTKYDRSQNVLPRMIMEGVISTGFNTPELDLSPIIGKDYQEASAWIQNTIPNASGIAKSTLARFAGVQPGDVIALKSHSAPQGGKPRLVIARYAVVAGDKKAIYAQSAALGHTLKVDFLDEQEPIELALGYGKTLHAIENQDRIAQIFGQYAEGANLATLEDFSIKDRSTHSTEVAARGQYIMQRIHNKLQNQLREQLISRYGQKFVKQEEGFVDLMLSLKHQTIIFEVKSSPSPLTCIREALGQLFYYSWKHGLQSKNTKYVVVGPSLPCENTLKYIAHIEGESKIDITYCTPTTFAPCNS